MARGRVPAGARRISQRDRCRAGRIRGDPLVRGRPRRANRGCRAVLSLAIAEKPAISGRRWGDVEVGWKPGEAQKRRRRVTFWLRRHIRGGAVPCAPYCSLFPPPARQETQVGVISCVSVGLLTRGSRVYSQAALACSPLTAHQGNPATPQEKAGLEAALKRHLEAAGGVGQGLLAAPKTGSGVRSVPLREAAGCGS